MGIGDLRIRIIANTKKLENQMKKLFRKNGITKSSSDVDLQQPDISAWVNDKRKWSIEKMLKVSEKINGIS